MKSAKLKTLKTSGLEKIKGIGPKKAKILLSADVDIKSADAKTLEEIKGISKTDAENIAKYFAAQNDKEKK